MPLKGCNMKSLYPAPELRMMGDADILIRMEQYEKIRPILQNLGFEEKQETDHELVWQSKGLYLELHKRLIPSYNKDLSPYFGDGWKLARPMGGCRYGMKPEEEWIFLFTHFAKHYRDGGIGCRHVADLWVYRRAHPEMDEDYVAAELNKLHLLEFERNIRCVTAAWFEGEQPDAKTQFITDFIFGSGSWGKAEDHLVSAGVKSVSETGSVARGRSKRILEAAFPSAQALQNRYPILKKHPQVLPLIWPMRWVTAVLFRRSNICAQREKIAAATPEKIKTYQEALHYVGLDFNFKE
jgi:hypothetical protein